MRLIVLTLITGAFFSFSALTDKPRDVQSSISLSADSNEMVYQQILAFADSAYKKGQYDESFRYYTRLCKIKPEEIYPREQARRSDLFMDSQEEMIFNYDKLLNRADSLFDANSLKKATAFYDRAVLIWPDNFYASSMLSLSKLADSLSKEKVPNLFAELVVRGDASFSSMNYIDAKRFYERAQVLDPKNMHIPNRLEEINAISNNELKNENLYNVYLDSADTHFDLQLYPKAIRYYENALVIMPASSYGTNMIRISEFFVK